MYVFRLFNLTWCHVKMDGLGVLTGRYFFASEIYDGFLFICGGLNDNNYNGGNFNMVDCDEERVAIRKRESAEAERKAKSRPESNMNRLLFPQNTGKTNTEESVDVYSALERKDNEEDEDKDGYQSEYKQLEDITIGGLQKKFIPQRKSQFISKYMEEHETTKIPEKYTVNNIAKDPFISLQPVTKTFNVKYDL